MATVGPAPTLAAPVAAAVNPAAATSSGSSSTGTFGTSMIAGNFNTFLQLLTTQLKNQNPLSPMDTNQFTQQLVEFASVEQQINMNTQLTTLISLQKTAQATSALSFVGATVAVDGNAAQLANGRAAWTFTAPKPATAAISIADATGRTVFSANQPVQAGTQTFVWDGRDSFGKSLQPGPYTMTVTAADATGQPVAISTQVTGVVDSVDVTQTPPLLSINGQKVPLDKIKQVFRNGL
ncbi:MAG TPA: flagellar hook capping FlgD N-terminal domain-containing protein [Xanthobacteraceae bacterium]|nr:flagellar hook capping FlgD N-terminal domain-containing protein [Xanthobacteraceae bacterium]